MGRFSYEEADNYGNGGSNFLTLKNDKDTVRVRFMYNFLEDIEGYAVHEVNVGDKKKYVNCLREYNEPKSVCPLCAENSTQKAKLYIPVYVEDEGVVKVWERGKTFFAKLSSLCTRYTDEKTPLVANVFEIERNGKAGDTKTTYEVYQLESDDTRLEDLPEVPEILGSIILDKTAEEMEEFLDTGYFPEAGEPARRPSRRDEASDRREERPVGRRTPSRRSSNNEDKF